jgi:uncharacterized protein Yka (UPF0111/DUF47 family)
MNADRITSEDMRASVTFPVPMSKGTVLMLADQQDELLDVIARLAATKPDDFDPDALKATLHAFGRPV